MMKNATLQDFLPIGAEVFVKKWLESYAVQIIITNSRSSKLGDYRNLGGNAHKITINGDLPQELFFFVLTHEIAHLHTLASNKNIRPHGVEWKSCYAQLLISSQTIYAKEFLPILSKFVKNPKAGYLSTPEIVRYFNVDRAGHFVEELSLGNLFEFRSETYKILSKAKKRYLCENLTSGRRYLFRACAEVKKIDE